jgi:hypothetical protein
VWTVGDDGLFHWNGATFSQVDLGPNSQALCVRGIDSEVWVMGGRGAVFHGQDGKWERIALLEVPHVPGFLIRSANDVLLYGPVVYHWNGKALERPDAELEQLFDGYKFASLAGSKERPERLFISGATTIGLIEDRRLVAQAKLSGPSYGIWATAKGDVWAVGSHGIVYGRDTFHYASTHTRQALRAVSGDSRNIWAVGTQGTILRKRLEASFSD